MSTSLITKNALANSLKELMLHYPINKISVQMVTDSCEVTRHTFYNHFHDVYELLGWIFENEIIEELDEYCSLAEWKNGLMLVLQYTLNNRIICVNTCKSLGREHLEIFLCKTFQTVLEGVIEDITKDMHLEKKVKDETAEFFSYAITGEFLRWITNGFKEKAEDISNRIGLMLDGTITKILKANDK